MSDIPPSLSWMVDIPVRAGRVIGIAPYKGHVIIACEYAVYSYEEDFYTAQGHLRIEDGALWEKAENVEP